MRIEKVVIENINSLAGRFEIDFTDGKYSEGLFAITGPSGAGKTTVLDAVSLALYGKTPRIDTISETQDEIMNKNCGECRAEAVFISRGKRYRAVFGHKRSGGAKPFRQVVREVWEHTADGSWNNIAASIREADAKIEEITGLSYKQFTRSIMLAQFQFAEFLKSDASERAEILEQISDMGLYREISAAVYERAKAEKGKLEEIRTRMQLLKVLDEGQVKSYEEEQGRLLSSVTLHSAVREQLLSCRGTAEKLQNFRLELDEYNNKRAELEKELDEQAKRFGQAEQREKETKAALLELQKILKTVRDIDNKITVQRNEAARLDGEVAQYAEKINADKRGILNVFKKYAPDASGDELRRMYETEDIGAILRSEAKAELDGAAAAEKKVRDEISAVLLEKDETYWQKRADMLKILLPAAQAREEARQAGEKMETQRKKHEELAKSVSGLEAQEKESEEKLVYARLEEKFGEERRKLKNGKPCPLCGATEHPGAGKPFDSKFLEEAQKQKEDTAAKANQGRRELAVSGSIIAELEKTIEEKARFAKQKDEELIRLGGAEYSEMAAGQAEKELAEAENVMRGYTVLLGRLSAAKDNVTAMTEKLASVDVDVTSVNAAKQAIKELMRQAAIRREQKDEAEKLYNKLKEERIALFGEKDADGEEAKAQELFDGAQRQKESSRTLKEGAERSFEQNKKDIARTQERIGSESRLLSVQYNDARIRVAEAKEALFADSEEIRPLAEKFIEAVEGFSETAQEGPGAYDGALHILNELVARETSRQGAVGQMLADNAQKIKEIGQLKEGESRQAKTCAKWDSLSALIGSADGAKFSRMAQGYTFDALIGFANACLRRMTDRYALARDTGAGAKPLELVVADNYQAGERRPVSNLSGGESFIVSMALALGMSEMSSGKTRIDSLFIDEGFASLDEDYLEAALQTLSALGNREGKLVGVISHVGALKERIDAQIEVKKLSGGRSTLSGPGVRVESV